MEPAFNLVYADTEMDAGTDGGGGAASSAAALAGSS